MCRVIIAGCRDFNDYGLLQQTCDHLLQNQQKDNVIIVSGHATGADALGERYAKEKGYKIEKHPADWKKYGKAAGPIRNAIMAEVSSALIAFWDGKSRGTKNMIDLANDRNLQVAVVEYKKKRT